MERPGWEEYFSKITRDIASRSTCLRRKVGAMIVHDKRILATGYNGVPTGMEHCEKNGCLRARLNVPSGERHELCRGIHAEQNAIIQAAIHGVSIAGAKLFSTTYPCSVCAKMIVQAKISEVFILDDYPDELAKEILEEAKVKINLLGKDF